MSDRGPKEFECGSCGHPTYEQGPCHNCGSEPYEQTANTGEPES